MIKTYGHRSCEGVCVRFLPPGGAAAGLWLWWVGGSRLGVCVSMSLFTFTFVCLWVYVYLFALYVRGVCVV